ncbi:MAG: hypothetical protein CM15mP36_08980 [Flavobacteriales bacterium]|nr:MAG: hypothetical protein CM15mP36_08980 [Flavobacteriales bacterium]
MLLSRMTLTVKERESFTDPDFDYRDEYNEMFGWRSLRYNQIRGDAAIRDYGGQIVETLEFRPDMSTSIE